MVQLRSNQVGGVVVGVEDAVSLQLGVEVVAHLLGHVRVGIQLITQHVRCCHTVLETKKHPR